MIGCAYKSLKRMSLMGLDNVVVLINKTGKREAPCEKNH